MAQAANDANEQSATQPEISHSLNLQKVDNCRDMGGIVTKDGRVVRAGNLIRSASLHKASGKDLETLQHMGLQTVIDLRTASERKAEPDRLMVQWKLIKQPVFTEGGRNKFVQIKNMVTNPSTYLVDLYPTMLTGETAIACWKEVFRMLIDEPGRYLWHCTQGKDRTGVAAALILASLNVDDETIRADYLETNKFMGEEVPQSLLKMERYLGWRADLDINQFLEARPENFDVLVQTVAPYGGFRGYLRDVIGLTDDDFARLRDYYTVDRDGHDTPSVQ